MTESGRNPRSFTVWTLWQDGLGASKKQRFYAMIEIDGKWLSSLLVQNGLARIYGKRIELPGGISSRDYLATLADLESRAKADKEGGWK